MGFILDSSGSLRNDYDKEKDFLKALAATFGVSDAGARAGVVTFSYNAEHSIKLNDYNDIMSFIDAVDRIPLMGSTTRIDKAFRLTQKDLFSMSNGARPGVPKLLILLTDGSQTLDVDAEDPKSIAKEIRDSGVKLLVIGIGQGINKTELTNIGGGDDNVYSAASFDELIGGQFIDTIVASGCDKGKSCCHELSIICKFCNDNPVTSYKST